MRDLHRSAFYKKPLPKKGFARRYTRPHLPELTSAGVGTEHRLAKLRLSVRLPGFRRAGPSTPLDELIGNLFGCLPIVIAT